MSSPYGEPESALPDLASVWDQELEDSPEVSQARLVERRIEYLAPLMAYVRARGEQPGRLLNRASLVALGAGEPINRSGRLWARPLERGLSVIPPWLVERCCALLGQTVAAVMGDEWVKRFGADGRGGEGETGESAPVDSPRIRRPNRSDLAFWQSEDSNHAA
jgi:hypothetical protein